MITKYGKVIIEQNTTTITGFEFDCEEYKEPYMKKAQFDAIEWAKKRLGGKTSKELEEEKVNIIYPQGTPEILPV
jgi:hypothetical protein